MSKHWKVTRYVAAIGLVFGGCVGGSGESDSTSDQRVVVSDGTPGGDLVEVEMRYTQWRCRRTFGLESEETCWDDAWPEGAVECVRDAVNQNLRTNEQAVSCVTDANWGRVVCLDDDWVFPYTCRDAFHEAMDACPVASSELRAAVASCPYDMWHDLNFWARR